MDSNIDEIYETMNKLNINPVGYIFDERMLQHKHHSDDHPERPERAMIIYSNLISKGLKDKLVKIDSSEISYSELRTIYEHDYINTISNLQYDIDKDGNKTDRKKNENKYSLCYDTYDNYATFDSAKVSAGCLMKCCKAIVKEDVSQAFAIIRPPGHHANSNQCRGFCFFNNIALSVEYLTKEVGYKVAIVDWDVHHGDGTQEIYYEKNNPLFISLHRYDNGKFYPHTGKHTDLGKEEGAGYNINIPWNNECYKGDKSFIGDDEYYYAFETVVLPALREYKPDIILVSCGFDAAENDPLGKMSLTPIGYSYMTNALRKVCNKVVMALEGGYNLNSLSRCSEAIIRTLLREETPFKGLLKSKEIENLNLKLSDLNENYFAPCKKVIKHINNIRNILKPYWKCFETGLSSQIKEIKSKYNKEIIAKLNENFDKFSNYILPEDHSEYDYISFKTSNNSYDVNDMKYKRKINIHNRTTLKHFNFRFGGIKLKDYSSNDPNLYNWNGKEGYFNVYEQDIPLIIQKFLKTKKIKKETLLDKLSSTIEYFNKNMINFSGVKIYFMVVEKVVEKLSSTRNKTKPELEIFISKINDQTYINSEDIDNELVEILKKIAFIIENEVL